MDFLFEPIWKDFKKLQGKSRSTCEHSMRVGDLSVGLLSEVVKSTLYGKAPKHIVDMCNKLNLGEAGYKQY